MAFLLVSSAAPRAQTAVSLQQCVAQTVREVHGKTPTDALWQAENFCNTLLEDNAHDEEQQIRADNYVFQRSENSVLMWMVVAITLAGVVLAGAQLWASYSLAIAGRAAKAEILSAAAGAQPSAPEQANDGISSLGATIHLSKDELAVQSSVIGVVVLAISFAFFLVFVLYVYTFQEPSHPSAAADQTAPHQISTGEIENPAPPK